LFRSSKGITSLDAEIIVSIYSLPEPVTGKMVEMLGRGKVEPYGVKPIKAV